MNTHHSPAPATSAVADSIKGGARFHVPTMDCASEESEIRRAVEHITGIRAMTFQLSQRTIAIDAPLTSVEQAVAAIRKAGFDPQPVQHKGDDATSGSEANSENAPEHGAGLDNAGRLGGASLLSIGAEVLGFFATDK